MRDRISIAPPPLTPTAARVGPFSTALHQRRAGDRVGWRGPYECDLSLSQLWIKCSKSSRLVTVDSVGISWPGKCT
ncbi:MAG: hypothetical protein SWK90_00255 [Chloroflexota bacterium]|nr:hypothetical protein [Chloroflexota bacterium]